MERGARRIDVPTVMGVAALLGVVSTQLHEAVGHGGACLVSGRHVREWGAFYLDCDTHAGPLAVVRFVAAAGSTLNLITAVIALLVLLRTPVGRGAAWFFWWLLATVSAFQCAGYYLFSGVSGIGDWGAGPEGVFVGVGGWTAWRILLAVGGGGLYYFLAIRATKLLADATGRDESGRRAAWRLCLTAYLTIGSVACVIGLLNPVGLFILLASAIASSFGGPSGLAWMASMIRPGVAPQVPLTIARGWAWIIAGAVAVLAEGIILGPSLHF